jgi:phosphatidate cytidylyltransferase
MKTRIISAIVMIALFIPLLIIGKIPYLVMTTILAVMGMWELMRLEKIPMVFKILSYLVCIFLIISSYVIKDFNPFNYYIMIGLFLLYSSLMIINNDIKEFSYKDSLWILICTLMLGFMFKNFVDVRYIGMNEVIYLFLISTMTDTFALFSGKLFGKHKLTKISPNKTVEGSIGGSILGTIIPIVFLIIIGKEITMTIVVETFLLTIIGQIGDLYFSSIKRHYDVKDFSNLIPGHGGILDRLDSILFIMSAYIVMINII